MLIIVITFTNSTCISFEVSREVDKLSIVRMAKIKLGCKPDEIYAIKKRDKVSSDGILYSVDTLHTIH